MNGPRGGGGGTILGGDGGARPSAPLAVGLRRDGMVSGARARAKEREELVGFARRIMGRKSGVKGLFIKKKRRDVRKSTRVCLYHVALRDG